MTPAPGPGLRLVTSPAHPAGSPPLRAVARVRSGPARLDFEQLAARIPAVQWGLALAGDADLELHLACRDPQELREVVATLRRAGAAGVQVELVLRTLLPAAAAPSTVLPARSTVA
ncbi:Lrp/AsnC ligand binding domain-containing protein [Kitasatospora sp. NBC_00070]|uniref:Lrp/AsnC ligand binding domain-containing protein n=1 Tax=Kitasatospora sp. NBC_00070 TaxID=2975962 RepID=UPI003254D75C